MASLSLQRCNVAVRGARPAIAPRRCLVVRASKDEESLTSKLALPIATAMTASMLLGAQMVAPSEAMAARSGGRAGASGFSARRAQSYTPRAAAPQVNNYRTTTIVTAPPVYSPFGFGGFGFGGVRIMPVVPFPFFGGLLQLMFLVLVVSVVFNVIKGAIGAASGGSSKSKSQDWDDL